MSKITKNNDWKQKRSIENSKDFQRKYENHKKFSRQKQKDKVRIFENVGKTS